MQKAITAFVAADPQLRENNKILRSCKSIGPKSVTGAKVLAVRAVAGSLR
jgi:hypothetical protein